MIVFAAFTPHSPLLIPSIGKDKLEELEDTTQAMTTLAERLAAARPDTIAIISAHSTQYPDTFSINLHDEYRVDFSDFGDLSISDTFLPDLQLMDTLQRTARREDVPITLNSHASLDYGSGVPLHRLASDLSAKILPVSYSGLDPKAHLAFGRLLKEVFSHTNKRVAILASGDLSHCLTEDAPLGFREEGPAFDAAVKQAVEQLSLSNLLTMKPETIERADECAYKPLLILLGLLEGMHARPEILSYEHPFGVGYLVADFRLK